MSSLGVLVTVLAVAAGLTVAYFYFGLIRSQIAIANAALGNSATIATAESFFARLDARLSGWKTVILAWIAGLSQLWSYVTTDVLQSWQGLPWANVVDARVANWITIGCALLIPVVHARGVAHAAVTPPVDPGA